MIHDFADDPFEMLRIADRLITASLKLEIEQNIDLMFRTAQGLRDSAQRIALTSSLSPSRAGDFARATAALDQRLAESVTRRATRSGRAHRRLGRGHRPNIAHEAGTPDEQAAAGNAHSRG